MVSSDIIRASNERIKTELPPGLVGVFVGATAGIGCGAVRQFARLANRPRIYFIGRSKDKGERVAAELKELNPDGEYVFMPADVSLISNVDTVCREILAKEQAINILFMSMGSVNFGKKTSEDLHSPTALVHYSRLRFIVNLLPAIQRATGLRRVVSTFTATKEGPLATDDIQGYKIPFRKARGHGASLATLGLEAVAARAPDVTFIHNFPGSVETDLLLNADSVLLRAAHHVFRLLSRSHLISIDEAGERHAFIMTSARYPPKASRGNGTDGLSLPKGLDVVVGTSGVVAEGVYTLDGDFEPGNAEVQGILAKLRADGSTKIIWEDVVAQWKRITGTESI